MSFQQGLSGLNAASRALDVASNNVANAATVGFKSSTARFADVYAGTTQTMSGGVQTGVGVQLAAISKNYSQGSITVTQNSLDMAINGNGFFRMEQPSGGVAYSRNGQFQLNLSGEIIDSSGNKLTGFAATSNGGVATGSLGPLTIPSGGMSPNATSTIDAAFNLDASATVPTSTFSPTDPSSYNYSSAFTTYDSLGVEHQMQVYWRNNGSGSWDGNISMDGSLLAGAPQLSLGFDSAGNLSSGSTNTIAFTPSNGSAPMSMNMDLTGTTQFSGSSATNKLTQDGYAAGETSGLNIDADGKISVSYSNGMTKLVGQVAMSYFQAPQGLIPLGGNLYAQTAASGQALTGSPNTGALGSLTSGAVEESNVDLTEEMINMIIAQRNYQANAQSIKTQDSLMQTLVNLR